MTFDKETLARMAAREIINIPHTAKKVSDAERVVSDNCQAIRHKARLIEEAQDWDIAEQLAVFIVRDALSIWEHARARSMLQDCYGGLSALRRLADR